MTEIRYLMLLAVIAGVYSSGVLATSSANESPMRENNAGLQQQLAGSWEGYSGKAKMKIGLCANGEFMDYTASSYTGGDGSTLSNTAIEKCNRGSWMVYGDTGSGVIVLHYYDGSNSQLNYQHTGDPACLNINGNALCKTSPDCR